MVCHRNAEGLTWDGQGEMPSWLKRCGGSLLNPGRLSFPPEVLCCINVQCCGVSAPTLTCHTSAHTI
ncbi:protein of unknown function (plasmid) [Cupriavidus taiwanensis]|uniref:Uncharacterized protein n=1 Tax=Cupriavidus taiwanensis TaxID=164546 RepID=A0A375IT13_9BURK|nr:protein of unknown function [Cupriavidus taiwanensis]